jgi:hypothetical protein
MVRDTLGSYFGIIQNYTINKYDARTFDYEFCPSFFDVAGGDRKEIHPCTNII